ncbi:MAG TPA: glycosyltransferase family 87 protein [Anaerolineae bacterium]|nr:glycosyltransferase family 87 protein [Anaerolineae bacterium]
MRIVATLENTITAEVRSRAFCALTAVSILILSLAYQVKTPFAIDVGDAGDEAYVADFFDVEYADALSYRWSGNISSIVFPGIGAYAPARLRLSLNGHRPAGLPLPTVTVRANGRELGSFPVTDDFETYDLPIDRDAVGTSGTLRVELSSHTFVPHESSGSGDRRELGVLVDKASVQFQGGLGTIVVPAPLPVLCLTVAVLVSYLLARRFVSTRWSLVVSLAMLGGLALALATIRMQVAAYSPWVLVVPGVGLLVLETAHRTTSRAISAPLYAAGVATILLGLWRFASVAHLSWMGVAPDLANNYHTAVVLRSGGMIYDVQAPLFTGYDNPPLTAILTTPLTLLDLQSSIRLFFGLNTLLLATSVALIFITRKEYLLTYPYWMIAVALVLNLDPVLDSLLLGQLDAVILLLIVTSFYAYRQGRDLVAGSSLGLATMIKFSPFLLILYFLLKKQLRVFASAVAATLVIGILSLTLAGFDVHKVFVAEVLPTLLAGSAQMDNQSLNGFFNRLFLNGKFITDLMEVPPIPQARLLTLGSSILLVGIAAFLVHKNLASRTGTRFDLEFSLIVVALPLLSSIAWHHYMTWYVLPFLVLLNPKLRVGLGKRARPAMVVLAGLSCMCLCVPMSLYVPTSLEGATKLLISMRLYAGLTLYAVFAYLLTRQSAGLRSEASDLNTESGLQ